VPDEAFDVLMARLTPAEFKVMMYIVRRTFGFKKNSDAISLRQIVSGVRTRDGRQLDYGTGLSKSGVVKAIRGLLEKNVIRVARQATGPHTYDATLYALNLVGQGAQEDSGEPVHSVDSPSTPSAQRPVHSEHSPCTQDTQPPVHSARIQDTHQDRVQETHSNTGPGPVVEDVQSHTGENTTDSEGAAPRKQTGHEGLGTEESTALAEAEEVRSYPGESEAQGGQSRPGPAAPGVRDGEEGRDDQREAAVSQLVTIGVSQVTARHLAAIYAADRIGEVLSYLARRSAEGWRPRQTAAWVVAALREGYETLGDGWQDEGEEGSVAARPESSSGEAATELAGCRTRAARSDFSVTEEAAELWQEALAQLRSRDQWTPALSACFLREDKPGCWAILVPHPSLTPAIQARLPQIEEVLADLIPGLEGLTLAHPRAVTAADCAVAAAEGT